MLRSQMPNPGPITRAVQQRLRHCARGRVRHRLAHADGLEVTADGREFGRRRSPFGAGGRTVLLAVGAGVLAVGCSVAPSQAIGVQPSPRATSHPAQDLPTPTSFQIDEAYGYAALPSRAVRVRCSDNNSRVVISGSVQGAHVVVIITNLHPGQDLTDPPIVGGFPDRISMKVTPAGSQPPLTYVGGDQDGTYQGEGTLTVAKSGAGGTINISFGAPVGQSPSQDVSGNQVTFGANEGSVFGTWSCG